jgi:hypothetical protein
MPLFDFSDLNKRNNGESTSVKEKLQDKLVERFEKEQLIALDNLSQLSGIPQPGECCFIWSLKSFNAFAFIQYVIQERGKIDELTITSYNVGKVIIEALMHLVDNNLVDKLHVVASDVAKTRFPQYYELMINEASKRSEKVTAAYCWNHSKVALMRAGSDRLVVEGSGNFADNARHEQYLFANSVTLYDFRKQWINNVIK